MAAKSHKSYKNIKTTHREWINDGFFQKKKPTGMRRIMYPERLAQLDYFQSRPRERLSEAMQRHRLASHQ